MFFKLLCLQIQILHVNYSNKVLQVKLYPSNACKKPDWDILNFVYDAQGLIESWSFSVSNFLLLYKQKKTLLVMVNR